MSGTRPTTSVWAVTFLFTRAGFRKPDVSRALAAAVVAPAAEHGVDSVDPRCW